MLGSVRHPLNRPDFSSCLLAAKASGAKVVAFASAGNGAVTAIKQAHEFGLGGEKQRLVMMALLITDVHGLGQQAAQGLTLAVGSYWDRTEATRAWSRHFFDRVGRMPTREQAETYSAVLHYLRAVAASRSTDPAVVTARMKATPVDDFYAPGATLREDGCLIHPAYIARVKAPAEPKYPWDYYQIVGELPGDQAFRPMSEGRCCQRRMNRPQIGCLNIPHFAAVQSRPYPRGGLMSARSDRSRLTMVCKLNGPARGMCATIVSLCDVVIAADTATLADTHISTGLAAADGCNAIWPFIVGFARTKDLLFNARALSAAEARELGLVTQVVSAADLDGAVERYVTGLLKRPVRALQ